MRFRRTRCFGYPSVDVHTIFKCSPHGTKRVDMLFRLAQQRLISRTVVATVAQQEDYMKRVRGNGGSRSSLRPEGIVIIGQYESHRRIAQALAIPVPGPGESVSVRLARRRPGMPGCHSSRWMAVTGWSHSQMIRRRRRRCCPTSRM